MICFHPYEDGFGVPLFPFILPRFFFCQINYGLPKWRYTVNLIIHTLIVNIFMNFVFWVLMVHIFARN